MHDLKHKVNNYDEALSMILDMESNNESFDELKKKDMDQQL